MQLRQKHKTSGNTAAKLDHGRSPAQEPSQQNDTWFRQERFRVKLPTLDGVFTMSDAHDLPLTASSVDPSGNF